MKSVIPCYDAMWISDVFTHLFSKCVIYMDTQNCSFVVRNGDDLGGFCMQHTVVLTRTLPKSCRDGRANFSSKLLNTGRVTLANEAAGRGLSGCPTVSRTFLNTSNTEGVLPFVSDMMLAKTNHLIIIFV